MTVTLEPQGATETGHFQPSKHDSPNICNPQQPTILKSEALLASIFWQLEQENQRHRQQQQSDIIQIQQLHRHQQQLHKQQAHMYLLQQHEQT